MASGDLTERSLADRCVQLLEEADALIDKARSAASKLNVEMRLRHSMPSWHELDRLIDQRDAMRDWQKQARAITSAASTNVQPPYGSTEAFVRAHALAVAVAAHFEGTDAPLGQMARDFIAKANGFSTNDSDPKQQQGAE